jgi:hypothetical protein
MTHDDNIPNCEEEIASLRGAIADKRAQVYVTLGDLHFEVCGYAVESIRSLARRTVMKQHEVTLRLGRDRLKELKSRLSDHLAELPRLVEDVLDPVQYGRTDKLSSGMVREHIEQKFNQGIRHLLASAGPLFVEGGYQTDGLWAVKLDGEETPYGVRFPPPIELPSKLIHRLDDLIDHLTEITVIEAKIEYYQHRIRQIKALSVWDSI